jgi:hypothetical protein
MVNLIIRLYRGDQTSSTSDGLSEDTVIVKGYIDITITKLRKTKSDKLYL